MHPDPDLPERLARRLHGDLPGRRVQRAFEPELSYGRHYSRAPRDARAAAVMLLLYPDQGVWKLPLTVRPTSMVDHAGQVSFPGGTIEPGEASQAAALRELEEELGVSASTCHLLGRLSPLYLFVSHYHITPWVAVIDERPAFAPHPREVAELLEVPLAHLCSASSVGAHVREHRGLRYRAPHFDWQGHRIWGATCMMLGEFVAVVHDVLPPASA